MRAAKKRETLGYTPCSSDTRATCGIDIATLQLEADSTENTERICMGSSLPRSAEQRRVGGSMREARGAAVALLSGHCESEVPLAAGAARGDEDYPGRSREEEATTHGHRGRYNRRAPARHLQGYAARR